MMKHLLIQSILLVFLAATATHAQQTFTPPPTADSIHIKPNLGSYRFYTQGRPLHPKELGKLLATNELAATTFKASKTPKVFATIFGYAGGFLIGWTLGSAIAGGTPNWTVAGVGAGLAVVSIPFTISANKKTRKAIGIFNAGIQPVSSFRMEELHLKISENGVGIALGF